MSDDFALWTDRENILNFRGSLFYAGMVPVSASFIDGLGEKVAVAVQIAAAVGRIAVTDDCIPRSQRISWAIIAGPTVNNGSA